jgi:peroxiredoxin 2/4
MVNKAAPLFQCPAVVGGKIVKDFSLEQYLGQQEVIFFFYPKDFSSLCPTELWAFQEMLPEFEKRKVAVVGCSTDSETVHQVWLRTPRSQGGIEGITYPLVADFSKTISANYGVLGGNYYYEEDGRLAYEGPPMPLRATFLIDKEGVVRHFSLNHFPLGRGTDEILRMVDAWQHNQQHGEICPANWKKTA